MRLDTKEKRMAYRATMIPKNAQKITSKLSSAVAYIYKNGRSGMPCAMFFVGTAGKPQKHVRFRNEDDRRARVTQWFADAVEREQRMKARRSGRNDEGRGVEVGDVLVSSWGYDQTNIDYYQVTKLIGKTMVEIREIGCDTEQTGWEQGNSTPRLNKFIGEPMRKQAVNGSVKVRSFAWANRMEPVARIDGVPMFKAHGYTSYA